MHKLKIKHSNRKNKIDNWIDQDSEAWMVTKLLGAVSAGVLALVGAIFLAVGAKESANNAALQTLIDNLDKKTSVTFNSVADCTAQGFSPAQCKASYDAALDISDSLGTKIEYGSAQACAQKHHLCHHIRYAKSDGYVPPVLAWQAAKDDIRQSAPLYPGFDKDTLVRKDGKVFQFNLQR